MNLHLRLIVSFTFYFFTITLSAQTLDCDTSTIFEVGDSWTYSQSFQSQAGASPKVFRIEEELEWKGRQALVIRPAIVNDRDYLVQEEGRVYFWDSELNEYVLNYDYNNDSIYYFKYLDYGSIEADSSAIFIDSIKVEQIDDQDIQVQYCRSDFGFGGTPQPFRVFRGIGSSSFGVRLPLRFLDILINDLRCFESSDCSMKFVDFPCDTSTVSVHDLKSNIDLKIHPNPVNDRLYLETTDHNWTYQIINLQGQQMNAGQYQDHIDVDQLQSGIYFLQLQKDDELYQAIKFVKE